MAPMLIPIRPDATLVHGGVDARQLVQQRCDYGAQSGRIPKCTEFSDWPGRPASGSPSRVAGIDSAGGNVGPFAVQIAKNLGAEVTGVDSTGKLDMVRSVGADHVIDYTRENVT